MEEKLQEIKHLQEEIDYRTGIENEAIKLIEECKFNEAIELLAIINKSNPQPLTTGGILL